MLQLPPSRPLQAQAAVQTNTLEERKFRNEAQRWQRSREDSEQCPNQTCRKSYLYLLASTAIPQTPCGINLKSAIMKTSADVPGHTKKKNRDCFNEKDRQIQHLLTEKRAANQGHLAQLTCPENKNTFDALAALCSMNTKKIQNEWWKHLALST